MNVNLFKGLTHVSYGERDHTVVRNNWCRHAWFGVACIVAGFLISVRIRVPLLESGSSSLELSTDVACNPWLLVGMSTYGRCGENVVVVND